MACCWAAAPPTATTASAASLTPGSKPLRPTSRRPATAYNIRYTGQFTRIVRQNRPARGGPVLRPAAALQLLRHRQQHREPGCADDDNRGLVTNRSVNTAYRVRFERLTMWRPRFERNLFSFLKLGVGPQYDQFRVEQDPIGTVIKDSLTTRSRRRDLRKPPLRHPRHRLPDQPVPGRPALPEPRRQLFAQKPAHWPALVQRVSVQLAAQQRAA